MNIKKYNILSLILSHLLAESCKKCYNFIDDYLSERNLLLCIRQSNNEVKEKIGYVTINRPEALNALNSTVLEELFDVFQKIDDDADVRCVILTGEGRAFVAGADIAQMSTLNAIEGKKFAAYGHKVMNYIEKIETPVIAAVNGFTGWRL